MRRYWPLLVVLASLWGSSYLFIKVGVEGGLSPSALMFGRTLLAGSLLLAYLAATPESTYCSPHAISQNGTALETTPRTAHCRHAAAKLLVRKTR